MTKHSVYRTWYLRNHSSYDHHLRYIHEYKMFFLFFQNFDFLGCLEGQRENMPQNDKKLCTLHFISQEPYIIWSWFMVHMCKRIIFPSVFYIFWNFNFQVQYWGKRAKHDLKWQKIVCCTPYLSKHTSYDRVFCCTSFKW